MMKCVNCGTELKRGQKVCPNCGDYAVLAAKVKRLSVKFYNEGLKLAKNRELTNACDALNKSIKYDKENIQARNLLGVVLFEKGRYGEAIEQWKISYYIKSEDNIAVDYLMQILGNKRLMKKFSKNAKIFNEALELLKNGNDDLAVIRIKRLIDINHKAIDAYNMYILLLIKLDKKAAAYSMCKKVLSMDDENRVTLEYLRYLRSEKTFTKKNRKNGVKRHIQVNESLIITPVAFIGGVICAIAVVFALIIPSIEQDYTNKYDILSQQYNTVQEEHEQFMLKAEEERKKLADENENLKSKLYTSGEQELQMRISKLSDIQKEYEDGNTEKAAKALIDMDIKGFSDEVKKQYEHLKSVVLPAAAQKYYEKGKSDADNGNYDSAVSSFEDCIKCTSDGEEIRYSAMYQLAKIADDLGDSDKAKQYFAEVAKNHPVESIKNEAQRYIDDDGDSQSNDEYNDSEYNDSEYDDFYNIDDNITE